MTRLCGLLALAFAYAALAAPVAAQVTESKPIKIKQPKIKKDKFKGTVVSATMLAITVRDAKDIRIIRTFHLAPKASEKMVKIIEAGGYQVGDPVTIVHERGSDTALEVKGKPSGR